MGPATALNVRRLGLIVEAVCMVAILSLYRREDPGAQVLLGVPTYRLFQVGLACGLVLWCVGTLAYRQARRRNDA